MAWRAVQIAKAVAVGDVRATKGLDAEVRGMNAGILSIRNVLCGVIGLMGLLITVLMGNAALQAYQRNAAAQRIAAISLLDKALFEGVQHFRFERGTMDLILSLEPDKNGREVEFALTHRRGVDSALGVAFGGLDGLHFAGLDAAVDALRAEYQDFKAARQQADGMADLSLELRDGRRSPISCQAAGSQPGGTVQCCVQCCPAECRTGASGADALPARSARRRCEPAASVDTAR